MAYIAFKELNKQFKELNKQFKTCRNGRKRGGNYPDDLRTRAIKAWNDSKEYVSAAEFTEKLGISPVTLRTWIEGSPQAATPAKPATPAAPAKPAKPAKLVTRAKAAQPATPAVPAQLALPAQPVEPAGTKTLNLNLEKLQPADIMNASSLEATKLAKALAEAMLGGRGVFTTKVGIFFNGVLVCTADVDASEAAKLINKPAKVD